MKKFGVLAMVLMLLAAAVFSASADSVWMPMDDYFMSTWDPDSDNTCESQDRPLYIAAGPNGYTTAVRSPLDPMELRTYPNGTEFVISFICGSGSEKWGAVHSVRLPGENVFTEDYMGKSGYIPMRELARSYDSEAFVDLNFNSIYGFADDLNLCEPGFPFVIWSYPGSGVQLEVVTEDMLKWFCHDYTVDSQYFPIRIDRVYYAPDGTRWLSVYLTKPSTHGWLNLEHPMDGAVMPTY